MAILRIIVGAGIIGAGIFIVLGLVSDYFFGHWPDVLSLMGMSLLVSCFGLGFLVVYSWMYYMSKH